ncbi:hypothetical protein OK344_07990 [Kaistella sp. BT6-1-3]|uniref:DUF2231 domain-containing protein n=1 Tax=Kaistella yananensis TaxID=2989820 RepID=A0ABT3JN19_9FLAO|nr:hypothetical protein [Kaistella yananensis]MCW4452148.1 hypothetical protein [Kaistella yananensis]
MNNAHLHLVVNHLPIIFPVVGVIILLIGIITKSDVSKRNAYIVFVLGAAASVAAIATGEGAEHAIENIQGVSEKLMHDHEEAAEIFAGMSFFLGVISLLGLLTSYRNFSVDKLMPVTIVIVAGVSLYFAQEAGRTGGEIRHTEIRSGAAIQDAGENSGESDDD